MTYNICPSTFSKLGKIISPNGARFLDEEGILPKLILDLYKLRNEAKKNKDKIRSYAIKINMNSFYGAMASPKCRFYNFEIGEAITSFSKQTLIETKKFIEENNFGKVIYGDTDSCFVKIKEKNLNQNIQKEISQKVNDYFSKKIFEKYKRKSFLNLESEKKYDKFFIASKKRYVGFNLKNKEFDFVGMEYVRGDWTKLARNFQKKILKIIF